METLTLAQAARLLRPGMTVFIHGTATEPRGFVEYLAAHPRHLDGVHVIVSFIPGINTTMLAGLGAASRVTTFMMQPSLLPCVIEGDAKALRLPYSQLSAFVADLPTLDIAFVQGVLQDADRVSTSVSGELTLATTARADAICLFDNPCASVPLDGPTIPARHVQWRCPVDEPLVQYLVGDRIDAVSNQIAQYVAELIEDGDTLQTGLGVIPSALFTHLADRRDLTLFSGMISDAVMSLHAAGALSADRTHVYGMALGSQSLYEWLHQRAGFRVADCGETHHRERLAAQSRFTAINSAIEVGLDGSVNAEQLGAKTISGPGGLPDYAWAGAHSTQGRSIIALPSANQKRGISRIVHRVANADAPTLPAAHVTHVVTEHGVADLQGLGELDRAHRLIDIADPAHRDTLASAIAITR